MPKNIKYRKRRFGGKTARNTAAYHHLDFRDIDYPDDEGVAYLMMNVKGVNMLDLNETEISNESIALLTKLEYVNELRAKDCCHLDNSCMNSLNKLSDLVFLHLKDTQITIDSLLQLSRLFKLKTLMFSAAEKVDIKEKILLLQTLLPRCDFVVNLKPWQFD